jgi:hypothetical protein
MSDADERQVGGSHYKDMNVSPWDVISTWSLGHQVGFHRGNALKYLMRAGSKDHALQDYKKAAHYLEKLIEVLSATTENGTGPDKTANP